MNAFHVWQLRFVIVLVVVTAFLITGIGLAIPGYDTSVSQAWAGGKDDDDDKGKNKGKGKDKGKGNGTVLDHFACYRAAGHDASEQQVSIVNQFTTREGEPVMFPIVLAELVMLCVPTQKIHDD
jgi:hypothetical protein